MPKKIPLSNILLFMFFFLSGIAGLIYEVVWAKYLSLIFGSTTYAHTLVLATFMGGLALGNFLLGNAADRVKNKLAFYGWLELGIALFCALTPGMFAASKHLYIPLSATFSMNTTGLLFLKFLFGAAIMLPPTILMGGTLPILTKFLTNSMLYRGENVARLYYINSFGAVAGTILGGFYLISAFGLHASIMTAVCINLLVGAVVILLKDSPLFSQDTVCDKKDIPCDPVEEQVHIPDNILRIGLISIFLSGFVAMTYEIVWIRLLSTVLGSSTYSFSLMLAAFISGITLGSFLISKRMPSTERTFLYFGVCELLIGMLLILTLPFYDKLPFLFFKLSGLFNRTAQTFTYYSMVKFLIAFLIMFPPTIFLGMTLPLVSKLATRNFRLLGKDVGNVFGINTLGNILGAACTGLVIMPALGLKNTMDLGIALNIAMGLVIIAHDPAVSRKIKSRAIVFSVLILAVYKLVVPDWNKLSFIAQVFRYGGTGRTFSSFEKSFSNKDIVFYNDGIDATVSVLEKGQISLFVNGKADASTGGDMIAQVLCAQLPLTLKTDAHDVLVIGLGSGVTCGSALTHPIEKLDLVEISEDVVKASYLFKDYNYSPLEDSRLRLHVEDAKTFLKRTPQKYDVIISEPSNPWMSGVASLFSIEYFSDCKAHLNEGGIMVQWVQAYETTDEIFEIILRTFQTAFDHVYVWNTGMRDILIMGCSFPFSPDINASSGAFSAERIKKDFSRIGINDLFTLLALQTSGPEKIKEFVSLGKGINSDYFPRLEYLAPLALYTKSTVNNVMKEIDERNISSRSKNLFVNKYIEQAGVTETNLSDLFYFLLKAKYYNEKILASAANYFYSKYPNNPDAMFAWSEFNTAGLDESIRVLHALISEEPNDHFIDSYTKLVTDRFTKTSSFLEPDSLGMSLASINSLIPLVGNDKMYKVLLATARLYYENMDGNMSIQYYMMAYASMLALSSGTHDNENDIFEIAIRLGFLYFKSGDKARAVYFYTLAHQKDPANSSLLLLKNILETSGRSK